MSRLSLIPVVALMSMFAPSVAHAQYAVVSPCSVDAYNCARISIVPAPPTALPVWVQPKPAAPVYVPPVYVAPPASRGIDPSIPLAVRPAPVAHPDSFINQLLLLEALAARRAQPAPAPAPYVPTPYVSAPAPPRAPGDSWMSAWIKGVN